MHLLFHQKKFGKPKILLHLELGPNVFKKFRANAYVSDDYAPSCICRVLAGICKE